MENPESLLRRAREAMCFRGICESTERAPVQREVRSTTPVHQSSHASYTALMRSHDRMGTRHIAGKSGQSGA